MLKSLDTLLKGISYPNSAAAQGLTELEKLNVESRLLMVYLETAPSSESNGKGNFLHSFSQGTPCYVDYLDFICGYEISFKSLFSQKFSV